MLTKEQSVLKSITDAFEEENMQTQYSVLEYKIDVYFHDYKLAMKVDEKGHKDRSIDHEIKRPKALAKNLILNLLELVLMKKILIFLKP